ncbi:MAG: helix-turn-helix transcriptional regulator [Coxiellaceae bacterium]|nr:helix-turn-helix transcriptional regulator [Coxiellaceae bacterium]
MSKSSVLSLGEAEEFCKCSSDFSLILDSSSKILLTNNKFDALHDRLTAESRSQLNEFIMQPEPAHSSKIELCGSMVNLNFISMRVANGGRLIMMALDSNEFVHEARKGFDLLMQYLPVHVYWKDLAGRYLGCNALQAKKAGLACEIDVIGKTSDDLPWRKHARLLRSIDLEVISTRKPVMLEEQGICSENSYGRYFSVKAPICEPESKKVVGIIGVSILISSDKDKVANATSILSKREKECLIWLLRGRSAQQIGRMLSISNKTAESYVQKAKIKMNCDTRQELFDKAYRLGYIDYVKSAIDKEAV